MIDAAQATVIVDNIRQAEELLHIGMAALFGVAFFLYGLVLQWRSAGDARADVALRSGRAAFLLATGLTIAFCTLALVAPGSATANVVTVGVALVLAVITVTLDRGPQGMPALSFLSGALIWLIVVVTPFVVPPGHVLTPRTTGWLPTFHVATAVAGEGLCVVSFCGSLLYLWDYRRLKQKVLERRPLLPSLDTLDRLVERTSVIGLALITTSLISGLALVFGGGGASVQRIKVVWAFTVWGWYVLSIFGRGFWGWRGRRGAQLSLWGTGLILVSLFGTVWSAS